MLNYYKLFNLEMYRQKGITITDEMVEKAYLSKKNQYLKMMKKETESSKKMNIDNEEARSIEEGEYLEVLEEAYFAIRTQKDRVSYDELLEQYDIVKSIVVNAINKIMREKNVKYDGEIVSVDTLNKEEMKMATEKLIAELLNYAIEEKNVTKKSVKKLKLVTTLFDKVYSEAYDECITKQKNETKKEKRDNSTIGQKAEAFNKLLSNYVKKIPKEYLDTTKQDNRRIRSEVKYSPIYKGKLGEVPPKENKDFRSDLLEER